MSSRFVSVSQCLPQPYGQKISVGEHELRSDEPEELGGKDSGPTPFEMLMGALGACTNITLMMYAARKGWELKHIATVVTHGKGEAGDVFTRTITLEGALDEEQKARLLEIADKCPVSRALETPGRMVTVLAE